MLRSNHREKLPRISQTSSRAGGTSVVARVVLELRSAGIPAVLSDDAGGYVCNHVFYGLRHLLATERPGTLGGFVHLPSLPEHTERDDNPSMTREELGRAVVVIVPAVAGARAGV